MKLLKKVKKSFRGSNKTSKGASKPVQKKKEQIVEEAPKPEAKNDTEEKVVPAEHTETREAPEGQKPEETETEESRVTEEKAKEEEKPDVPEDEKEESDAEDAPKEEQKEEDELKADEATEEEPKVEDSEESKDKEHTDDDKMEREIDEMKEKLYGAPDEPTSTGMLCGCI